MKCPHTNCAKHTDCHILDIIKKIPTSMDKCSYAVTITQLEKQSIKAQKKSTKIDIKPKRPKREKKSKHSKKEVDSE